MSCRRQVLARLISLFRVHDPRSWVMNWEPCTTKPRPQMNRLRARKRSGGGKASQIDGLSEVMGTGSLNLVRSWGGRRYVSPKISPGQDIDTRGTLFAHQSGHNVPCTARCFNSAFTAMTLELARFWTSGSYLEESGVFSPNVSRLPGLVGIF